MEKDKDRDKEKDKDKLSNLEEIYDENLNQNFEPEDKTELAKTRTTFALGRTYLAAERTYASWIRTGFSIASVGATFGSIIRGTRGIGKILGAILIITGMFCFVYGWWNYKSIYDYIKKHPINQEEGLPKFGRKLLIVSIITAILLVSSILGFYIMIILKNN